MLSARVYLLARSFLTLCEQLRRHQFLVHSQTRHDIFAVRVRSACVIAHASFLKVIIELYRMPYYHYRDMSFILMANPVIMFLPFNGWPTNSNPHLGLW